MPPEIPADSPSPPSIGRRRFVQGAAFAAAMGLARDALALDGGPNPNPASSPIRVKVWCEGTAPRAIYPRDVDGAIAADLARRKGFVATRGRLDHADSGLTDAELDRTDALVWWGRLRHDDLPESRARAIVERVRAGKLGLVALHGSYASKPFRALLGPMCSPRAWRDDGMPEHVTILRPEHPIARGVGSFTIPKTAAFSEPFAVPEPEAVVFTSAWDGGGTFRSGLTWTVGKGRVAFLRPGHDGFPVLFHPAVRQLIANASAWVAGRSPTS